MSEVQTLTITRLGAQGDGQADLDTGAVFVPYTLAGERVQAVVTGERGDLTQVVMPSPQRIAPPCPHFGKCGGCKLQHFAHEPYLEWKRATVAAAFMARGLDVAIDPVIACKGPRRRAVLSARQAGKGPLLGFHREGSHELVDLDHCVILHPSIVRALPSVRALIDPLLSRSGEMRVTVTWTLGGLDIALDDVTAKLTPEARARLAATAAGASFSRVSIARDPVYEATAPRLAIGSAEVVVPPGSFMQAVAEMEEEMARLVQAAAGKSKRVVDLFSGFGAFTLRLAQTRRVSAYDSDKAAIAALLHGLRQASGLKPVEAHARDLFREPLSATELKEFDCIVFDPPRAGADAQARMIAKSQVKTVIAVSCNPATLARDARTLADGSYTIECVTPLDQFHYSPHVEAVAVFRR